ncbi:hypothetical protein [Catenovulum adriaticum]|uniref:Uncharacterized protein n=1 Tax=Catenovulum adriaticum TaxID=2984846 RepID=A0ABY7AQL6_9ALTE|nr:hypothetical protein [Catenovulum sp. TS8]WAJ70765.1 hypothetical protein OLW01_02820 [Catenovulum sp. TS8]
MVTVLGAEAGIMTVFSDLLSDKSEGEFATGDFLTSSTFFVEKAAGFTLIKAEFFVAICVGNNQFNKLIMVIISKIKTDQRMIFIDNIV